MRTLSSKSATRIDDADLKAVSGGSISVKGCAFGYCASIGTDGVSFGTDSGPNAAAQVYAAVKKGMDSVK